MPPATVLTLFALVLFVIEAIRSKSLTAAGLACWVATLLV